MKYYSMILYILFLELLNECDMVYEKNYWAYCRMSDLFWMNVLLDKEN